MVYQSCDYLNGLDTKGAANLQVNKGDNYKNKLQSQFAVINSGGISAFSPMYSYVGTLVLDVSPVKIANEFDVINARFLRSVEVPTIVLSGQLTLYYNEDFTPQSKPNINAGDYLCLRGNPLVSGGGPAPLVSGGFEVEKVLMLALDDAKPGDFFDVLLIPIAVPDCEFIG